MEALWALGTPEPKKRLKRPDGELGLGGKVPKTGPQGRRFLPPFHRYVDLDGEKSDVFDAEIAPRLVYWDFNQFLCMYCKVYINYRAARQMAWFMFQTLLRRSALAGRVQ